MRRASERGHFQNDWLDSHHSFSFGDYYDPAHMGLSVLRVINDDRIAAGAGFPTHPHRDMEIVTYVLSGELEHKDSMGNGSVIRPGDVQRMSAGTGVTHSEFNPNQEDETTLLQIWFLPSEKGIEPGYDQKYFAPDDKRGQLKLIVSPDGRDGSLQMTSEALLYATLLDDGQSVQHELASDRCAYVHVASGEAMVNGKVLKAGDACSMESETSVSLAGKGDTEVLVFDLPVSS
jgi:redox-sensitive bicupin YhaK (pirin superfamily)